jgi:hypothetical protein
VKNKGGVNKPLAVSQSMLLKIEKWKLQIAK